MADNVTFQTSTLASPAEGIVISTDEGAGGHVQRMKLAQSADGSEAHIQADADGLLVNLGTNNDVTVTGTVTIGSTVTVDGSGVTQPVSGTVTVQDGGGSLTVDGTVGVSGTVTVDGSGVTQPVSGTVTVQDGGGSITVDGTVGVTGTFWQATQPVSGTVSAAQSGSWTVTADIGAGPFAVTDNNSSLTVDGTVAATQSGGWTVTANAGTGPFPVSDNSGSLTVDNNGTFAVQAAQSGTWTVQPGNTANTTAWKVDASSVAVPVTDNSGSLTVDGTVTIQDGGGSITVDGTVAATQSGSWTVTSALATSSSASLSNVNDTNANTTLLASNASRVGFAIYNDSAASLYVKYGTTASSTSFTFLIDPYGFYEFAGAGVYTGRIDGIWSSDSTGAARVTEW